MLTRLLAFALLLLATAAVQAADKVTYDDHARPVFREHCFSCHNQDKKKGGLVLESYAAVMEGGSSGEVVYAADATNSRLWQLVNHEDTPHMPPEQDKLATDKLNHPARRNVSANESEIMPPDLIPKRRQTLYS